MHNFDVLSKCHQSGLRQMLVHMLGVMQCRAASTSYKLLQTIFQKVTET